MHYEVMHYEKICFIFIWAFELLQHRPIASAAVAGMSCIINLKFTGFANNIYSFQKFSKAKFIKISLKSNIFFGFTT